MKEVIKNPVAKNIYIGGFIRMFGSTAIATYVPVFFQRVYPMYK
jgi:hypothetical protein